MKHSTWEAYAAVSRKVETGGRNADGCEDEAILAEMRGFIDVFRRYLPPPARVLAPGAIAEALLLAEAGYEVHALVLGPDNVAWINERKGRLPRPELCIPREHDAHELLGTYPEGYFDGYFTVQVHEHLLAPLIHIGEVRLVSRDGAVAFVDACGTTNGVCKMFWHTNLIGEQYVFDQWEFWGFRERWRGDHGDQRPQFVFEMLPWDDESSPVWKTNAGYAQWIRRLRRGEKIAYDYHCLECGT